MMTIRAQFLQQDDNKPTFAEPFTVKFTQAALYTRMNCYRLESVYSPLGYSVVWYQPVDTKAQNNRILPIH